MKDRNDCFSEITVPEDVLTFAEACERVAEGGKILLKHGLHTVAECVTLEKNIVILGDQIYPEKIILKGGKNAVLEMKAGFSEIRGITFLNEGSSCQAAIEFCASLGILAKCVFISEKGSGLSVLAKGANPVVSACVAQNCGESGFYVCGGAGGGYGL